MGTLKLLITGAALAAGINYITKKRADGFSIFEDVKAKAPNLANRAQPFIDQLKGRFSKVPHIKGNAMPYPQKFDNFSADSNNDYTS
ncbi:MAG TPA: hypothetical protein VGB63_07880 [Pedobacter sp.]|jgi:hypothetical protein